MADAAAAFDLGDHGRADALSFRVSQLDGDGFGSGER